MMYEKIETYSWIRSTADQPVDPWYPLAISSSKVENRTVPKKMRVNDFRIIPMLCYPLVI